MKAPEIDLLCEIELARFQAAEHFKAEAATWRLKIGLGSAGMQAFRETCVCVCVEGGEVICRSDAHLAYLPAVYLARNDCFGLSNAWR